MSLSMHQISIPLFTETFTALSTILEMAEAQCVELGLTPKDLLEKQLAPDMYTLTQQVQRASFHAIQAGAKLTGGEILVFEDNESSFEDLRDRIQKTIIYLAALASNQFVGSEDRKVEIQTRIKVLNLTGLDFLTHIALPQFLFHSTTAYDILRNAGIQIGKKDFLGAVLKR